MMPHLIPGMAISPLKQDALLSETHLILHVDKRLDAIVLIPVSARRSAGRIYFVGYKRISYQRVLEALNIDAPTLVVEAFKRRLESRLGDDDLNKKFRKHSQVESESLKSLKRRWQMIEPIVTSVERDVLFDKHLLHIEVHRRACELAEGSLSQTALQASKSKESINSDATEKKRVEDRVKSLVAEIKRLLNQYWAGGSFRGSLINFAAECGGRGKRKKVSNIPLGRRNARTKDDQTGYEPLVIEPDGDDEKIIMYCIDHYLVRRVTVARALRRMWNDFYSETIQLDSGKTSRQLLPVNRRPTRSQFVYRISLADPESSAWKKQLGPNFYERNFRSVMGSATTDIKAVGQRGGIDASPLDFQLVRLVDRLARIGGAHRILLADSMFGYIPGFYVGLEAPSSKTVRLAVHHALNPDKSEWLEGLGLDNQRASDWIPIHFAYLWADNTDLRSDEVMSCLHGIDTQINFVPVRRPDLNPMAESRHHMVHRLVDHKMLGSTYGEPRTERGETSAIDRARHTLIQAIRETARAVHAHNTMELDIPRPLWMMEQGVSPTRLHMTRAMIDRGYVARTLCSYEEAHIQLLPRHPGTFTPKGVRLHREGTGQKICFIERLVYVSVHPTIVQRTEEARRGGKRDPNYFRESFLIDPNAPRRCWYLDLDSMHTIELEAKVLGIDDHELLFEAALDDVVELMKIDAIDRPARLDSQQRKIAEMESEQEKTKVEAEAAYQQALKAKGGKTSKAQLRADRAANREAEKDALIFGMPFIAPADSVEQLSGKDFAPDDGTEAGQVIEQFSNNVSYLTLDIAETSQEKPRAASSPQGSALRAAVLANRKREVPDAK